jgi:phosphoribosylamine--glycine ligase/phosphoribosylformylglycinamidine cyclo-ligase
MFAGTEVSVLAFTDGDTIVPMPVAQDHKRAHEFDCGPNTGGMGAIAPVTDVVDDALMSRIVAEVFEPTLRGLREQGLRYVGVLFAGLMLVKEASIAAEWQTTGTSAAAQHSLGAEDAPVSIQVLEFNCRFGDPETQVVLPLLDQIRGATLAQIFQACCDKTLHSTKVVFRQDIYAATVVAASGGYPGLFSKGCAIKFGRLTNTPMAVAGCAISEAAATGIIFHAGTALAPTHPDTSGVGAGGAFETSGGRVLCATAIAHSRSAAIAKAYDTIQEVSFSGMFFRRDIGGAYYRPHRLTQPLRVAVLGSTRGTDLVPIVEAISTGQLRGASVVAVLSNKADAGILDKAKSFGIATLVVSSAGKTRTVSDVDTFVVTRNAVITPECR